MLMKLAEYLAITSTGTFYSKSYRPSQHTDTDRITGTALANYLETVVASVAYFIHRPIDQEDATTVCTYVWNTLAITHKLNREVEQRTPAYPKLVKGFNISLHPPRILYQDSCRMLHTLGVPDGGFDGFDRYE